MLANLMLRKPSSEEAKLDLRNSVDSGAQELDLRNSSEKEKANKLLGMADPHRSDVLLNLPW
jgi:hypothetical protein